MPWWRSAKLSADPLESAAKRRSPSTPARLPMAKASEMATTVSTITMLLSSLTTCPQPTGAAMDDVGPAAGEQRLDRGEDVFIGADHDRQRALLRRLPCPGDGRIGIGCAALLEGGREPARQV